MSPEDCFKYVCKDEYDDLKTTKHNPKDLEMTIDPDDLSKRVDLICRATKWERRVKTFSMWIVKM